MKPDDEAKARDLIQKINQAGAKNDLAKVNRLLNQKEAFLSTLEQEDRATFNKLSSQLNTQFNQLDASVNAFLGSNNTDSAKINQLMQDAMLDRLNTTAFKTPSHNNAPKNRTPNQHANQTTSQATLNRLNSEALKVPTHPFGTKAPKKTHQQPQKPPKQAQQRPAKSAPFKTQTKPQAPVIPQTIKKQPAIPKKTKPQNSELHQHIDNFQKNLTERRKVAAAEAKKEIVSVIKYLFSSKKNADKQEKTINPQHKQAIEQSVTELSHPDITAEQGIKQAKNILKHIKPTSENQHTNTLEEHTTPKAEQGWLTRALDKACAALNTLLHKLGLQTAKSALKDEISNISHPTASTGTNDTHSSKLDNPDEPNQQESPKL